MLKERHFQLWRRLEQEFVTTLTKKCAPMRPALNRTCVWVAVAPAPTRTAVVLQPDPILQLPVSAEGQVLQPAPPAIVKPVLFTQYILVLAGAADFRADSAAAWVEVHGHQSDSPAQCSVVYYNFDECFNVLVLLDLMDRVRAQFFMAVLLLPPASTWSRARHTGTGQWPLRSRSKPMACLKLRPTTTTVFSTPTKWWSFLVAGSSGFDGRGTITSTEAAEKGTFEGVFMRTNTR